MAWASLRIDQLRETARLARARYIVWTTALATYMHSTSLGYVSGGCMDLACRFGDWVSSFQTLADARAGVVAAALAASVALPVRVWLRPLRVTLVPRRFGALIALLCGVWAYCLARPLAWDAAAPLPFNEEPSWPTPVDLPPATRCELLQEGPLVIESLAGLEVDGVPVSDSEGLEAVLQAKRELWAQINPRSPFPGVVHFLLAPEYPAWEAGKLVRVAHAQGYGRIGVGMALPPREVDTHTAGRVAYRFRWCSVRLRGPTDWAGVATWGGAVALADGR